MVCVPDSLQNLAVSSTCLPGPLRKTLSQTLYTDAIPPPAPVSEPCPQPATPFPEHVRLGVKIAGCLAKRLLRALPSQERCDAILTRHRAERDQHCVSFPA